MRGQVTRKHRRSRSAPQGTVFLGPESANNVPPPDLDRHLKSPLEFDILDDVVFDPLGELDGRTVGNGNQGKCGLLIGVR